MLFAPIFENLKQNRFELVKESAVFLKNHRKEKEESEGKLAELASQFGASASKPREKQRGRR